MNNSQQRFWRGLFFILLITALCGLSALPAIPFDDTSAYAAPQPQATACTGTTIARWEFTGDVIIPSEGGGTFSIGSGLPSAASYVTGPAGAAPDRAVSFDNWTTSTTLDTSTADYIQLAVSTSGRNTLSLGLQYESTITGPLYLELHYSTNGTDFTPFSGTATTLNRNSGFQPLTFDLSSITGLNNNSNALFRIYAYGADDNAGALHFDNIIFTGDCVFSPLAVTINEVAWAGTGSAHTSDEWIELYNPGSTPISLDGWRLTDNLPTSTDIDVALTGTIPPTGYFLLGRSTGIFSNPAITINQIFSGSLNNGGETIYLIDPNNVTVDTANIVTSANWPAGTDGSGSPQYASMERRGVITDSDAAWATYAGTVPVTNDRGNVNPVKGTPGQINWITTIAATTITITTSPNPSRPNTNITVTVTVAGGSSTPTGTVTIASSGATSCTNITLNGAGSASCAMKWSNVGAKTITVTYSGDITHSPNTATQTHQVANPTSTPRPTPTKTKLPTPLPPQPMVGINEFVPRPGHDWNLDGVINTGDEYIELINHGVVDAPLSGYRLDDEANIGSDPYSLPAITLKPGERIVFYGSETKLLLSDGGDGVRLLKPNGQLVDAYNYYVVRFPDQSYCRLPDNGGLDDWNQNCFPTPGLQNSLSGNIVNPPTSGDAESLCPIADTLPADFVYAECQPFGNNIWNPAYWDRFGWFNEKSLPESPGKWSVFAD